MATKKNNPDSPKKTPGDQTPGEKKAAANGAQAAESRRVKPERRASNERRAGKERRDAAKAVAVERRVRQRRAPAAEGERRKVERRINEYPMKPEVLEFINAINEFKTVQQKPFPTWSDIFGIFTDLGYKRDQ